ncbi:MAG TPA: hypothetical protein VK558_10245 [Patescibacteria group bacterium]|nr:hypothetical protein [Patescibacteria group bacterium]
MMRIATLAAAAALLVSPALAQTAPDNNGVNELNTRGTIATAPSYRGGIPAPSPYDEDTVFFSGDLSPANHANPAAHPGANGLNWQPKNGHDS